MTNDVEWFYSTNALNVLNTFHESSFVVYVEGDYDVPFWFALFNKSGIRTHYIESAGGINELRKIMSQILGESANVIVACDTHYSMLLNTLPEHDQIISTFGHSMENTLYCPITINSVVDKLSHKLENRVGFITEWLTQFCNMAKTLALYDIAREKFHKSIELCADKCSRFLKTQGSSRLDEAKISDYMSDIIHHFDEHEIEQCKQLMDGCHIDIRYIINGHFLTNGVVNLIKNSVKRIRGRSPTIPLDNLYALMSDGCNTCTINCPEFSVIEQKITNAIASLRLL